MPATAPLPTSQDRDAQSDAVGRRWSRDDLVTTRLLEGFAGLAPDAGGASLKPGAAATLGIHWCLAPSNAPLSALRDDGHVALDGSTLPAIALPHRMWVGSDVAILDDLRVGDTVTGHSEVVDLRWKEGRAGPLCFVSVLHLYLTMRGEALRERQDIVYRDTARASGAPPRRADARPGRRLERIVPDPIMLFRYSALTFNAHRIHYDGPCATEVEGYPDLVVHRPLQASLLLQAATALRGRPSCAVFRAETPAICNAFLSVCATDEPEPTLFWTAADAGRCMSATFSGGAGR